MINLMQPLFREFIFAMLNARVNFLLIGGYAVGYHGYVRTTEDLDIWLSPTNENKDRFVVALESLQIDVDGFSERFDFTNVTIFHFGAKPERIDFLTKMMGIEFTDAFSKRDILEVDGYKIPFLALDDLIVNKLLSDRLKDRADVEELQKINKLK